MKIDRRQALEDLRGEFEFTLEDNKETIEDLAGNLTDYKEKYEVTAKKLVET